MTNDTFGKCRKHDVWLETREMHDGKTMQVCPKCNEEMFGRLRETINRQDAERGRPLTDAERLANLWTALADEE